MCWSMGKSPDTKDGMPWTKAESPRILMRMFANRFVFILVYYVSGCLTPKSRLAPGQADGFSSRLNFSTNVRTRRLASIRTTPNHINADEMVSNAGEFGLRVAVKNIATVAAVTTNEQQIRIARCLVKSAMAARRRTGSAAVSSNHLLYLVFIIA